MGATDWPDGLRHLLAEHGAEAVAEAGFEVLGYPPTWVTRGSEVQRIRVRLQEDRDSGN